ncbi:hypothetical protein ACIPJN_38595 [Streptomyces sp. NPDC086796]|uniref:hypothetical protein n=1 Tax=unclassified Streptomyces TaxID=2593676 RepID=UPI003803301F
MTTTILTPTAGGYGGWEDDDNQRGYERDETDTSFRQLVRQLVADGDNRAQTAGRRARRTFADMAPGAERQPVLRMATADIVFKASQACQPCGGQGGVMVDTSSDGVTRQTWMTCQTCRGLGVTQ